MILLAHLGSGGFDVITDNSGRKFFLMKSALFTLGIQKSSVDNAESFHYIVLITTQIISI